MCMLPGGEPVEKATVIDGTPCLSGGICVDGTCVVSHINPATHTYVTSLLIYNNTASGM